MSSITHTNVWTLERFSTLFHIFVDMKPFAGKREKFDSFLSFFDMTSKTFPLLYHIITVKFSLFEAYYEGQNIGCAYIYVMLHALMLCMFVIN